MAVVAVAAFPPMLNAEAVPVKLTPLPEKPVAFNIPVLGLKFNLVFATFCDKLPVVDVTYVG